MVKVRISISLSKELFDEIEEKRGLISRSGYIEYLLKKIVENGKSN